MKINYWQPFEPERPYHFYNRAVENEKLFRATIDYEDFLKKYVKYLAPYFELYAYCLMSNHFHFIVKVKPRKEVSESAKLEQTNTSEKYRTGKATLNQLIGDQFRRMFSSISIKYNNKYNRRGPLFTPKTKRVLIKNNDRLKYLIAYVHHNPIHHGYKKEYTSWIYSSYNSLISSKETLLARDQVLSLFGDKISFESYHVNFKLLKEEENIDEVL